MRNKDKALQSLIVHDIILKRKVSLDDLRKGMELNGFLSLVRKNPTLGRQMLTYTINMDKITPQSLLQNVEFCVDVNMEEKTTFSDTIMRMKENDLENLIQFVTGARDLSLLGRTKIQVEVKDQAGVFASSCTFKLILPQRSFHSTDALYQVLLAAANESHTFNAL